MSELQLIAFDADDTLWVNEPFYQGAERELEGLLAPYLDEVDLTEALYARERHNLEIFGYGAKGFTLSMIETAIELSEGRIGGTEIQRIIDLGKGVLTYPVQLLPGVREVIEPLAEQRDLMIITKGDLFDQESKIARSGLAEHFAHVEIVSEKSEASYAAILERHGVAPEDFLMIGNSLRSDVLPVVQLGGRAVYIPAETSWQHERAEVDAGRFERLESLLDLPAFLERLAGAGSSP